MNAPSVDAGRLGGLFLRLNRERWSGLVYVTSGARSMVFAFHGGVPGLVEEPSADASIADAFMAQNLITRDEYADVIARVTEDLVENEDVAFCEHAVRLGYLTREQVTAALGERVRAKLIQSLALTECEVELDGSEDALEGLGEYPQRIGPIVYIGVRTFYDEETLRGYLPDLGRHYMRLTKSPIEIARFFELDYEEIALLNAVDPQQRAAHWFQACDLDPIHTLSLVALLHIGRLCEFSSTPLSANDGERSGVRSATGSSRQGMPAVRVDPASRVAGQRPGTRTDLHDSVTQRPPSTDRMPAVNLKRSPSRAGMPAVREEPYDPAARGGARAGVNERDDSRALGGSRAGALPREDDAEGGRSRGGSRAGTLPRDDAYGRGGSRAGALPREDDYGRGGSRAGALPRDDAYGRGGSRAGALPREEAEPHGGWRAAGSPGRGLTNDPDDQLGLADTDKVFPREAPTAKQVTLDAEPANDARAENADTSVSTAGAGDAAAEALAEARARVARDGRRRGGYSTQGLARAPSATDNKAVNPGVARAATQDPSTASQMRAEPAGKSAASVERSSTAGIAANGGQSAAEYKRAHLKELMQRRHSGATEPGAVKRDPSRELRSAQESLRDGQYTRAEEQLRSLLEYEPSDPVRMYWLWSQLKTSSSFGAEQIAALRDLAKKQVSNQEHAGFACYILGHLFLADNKNDLAEKHFRKALQFDKSNKDAERHIIILERRKREASESEAQGQRKFFGIRLTKPKE